MPILFLIVAFIIMFGFFWHGQGSKKVLIVIVSFIGTAFIVGVTLVMLGMENDVSVVRISSILFWASWTIGLYIYNKLIK